MLVIRSNAFASFPSRSLTMFIHGTSQFLLDRSSHGRTWWSAFGKYYQEQEEVTLIGLHNTNQRTGDDLLDYIQWFRDTALECHVKYEEHELVEICIDNMFSEYKIHLKNLEIKQFAPLLRKVSKIAASWKTNKRAWKTSERSKIDKRNAP